MNKKIRPEGGDLISNLPESIISEILSLLPTKDAARTSVLSKDWEYKWTSSYNLDFYDAIPWLYNHPMMSTSFINFLERALLLSTTNLRSFSLRCFIGHEYDMNRLISWLSAVFRQKIEKVIVICAGPVGIVLPRSLIQCTSLRILELYLNCTLKTRGFNGFPNLTRLVLSHVNIMNENSDTDKALIFTFPVLRECKLGVKWLNVRFVRIHAPKLTTFRAWPTPRDGYDRCSITIFGDRLQRFTSFCNFQEDITVISGSSVICASLFYNWTDDGMGNAVLLLERGLIVRRLLKQFPQLKNLKLSSSATMAMERTSLGLLVYHNLERLVIDAFTSAVLFELLYLAPALKYLDIAMCPWNIEYYDYDAIEVPSCIKNTLEEVRLRNFIDHCPYHYDLAKFFMTKGVALKKLILVNGKYAVADRLGELPRNSACSLTLTSKM